MATVFRPQSILQYQIIAFFCIHKQADKILLLQKINFTESITMLYKTILFGTALAALSLAGCKSHNEEQEAPVNYTVTSPTLIDTTITKEYVAQIRSVQNIEIRAQEKGFLQKIYVDEGQAVAKGQLMFKIMPNLTEAESDKANAELQAANVEYQNTKMLADKNIVSKNELAVAAAHVNQAKAELRLAQTHQSFTEVRAPFSGIINTIPKKLGSLIDEGELLTSLSNNSSMYVYFNVSEPEYLNYMLHKDAEEFKHVHLVMANNESFPSDGIVQTIEGEFDPETGNIAFRALFQNQDHILRNGETGKVLMTVPMHAALVIPQKATYEVQDKKYVFVVGKDNKITSRNIKVLAEFPNLYAVGTELKEGDKILLDGIQTAKDNQQIKYKYLQPKDVLNSLNLKAE